MTVTISISISGQRAGSARKPGAKGRPVATEIRLRPGATRRATRTERRAEQA